MGTVVDRKWLVGKFRRNVVFSKAIFFMVALVTSYTMVEMSVIGILITHLTDEWKHQHLAKAAAIVNVSEGTSSILQIFFSCVADAYSGNYWMLFGSTIVYIAGLVLTSAAYWGKDYFNFGMFYSALVLITSAKAAKEATLKPFLDDQALPRDRSISTENEYERARGQSGFWWNSASLVAYAVAFFWLSRIYSFWRLTLISAIFLAGAFIVFLFGTRFSTRNKAIGSSPIR